MQPVKNDLCVSCFCSSIIHILCGYKTVLFRKVVSFGLWQFPSTQQKDLTVAPSHALLRGSAAGSQSLTLLPTLLYAAHSATSTIEVCLRSQAVSRTHGHFPQEAICLSCNSPWTDIVWEKTFQKKNKTKTKKRVAQSKQLICCLMFWIKHISTIVSVETK